MAITNKTQFANRFGLDLTIFAYDGTRDAKGVEIMKVPFVNVSNLDLSAPMVYATGGQNHANKVGFTDPIEGTVTLSTQLMTTQLLAIVAGVDAASVDKTVVFNNKNTNRYYVIEANTVWKAEDGTVYNEALTFHKVSPNRAFNISYSGEGDPTSVDVVFDLMADKKENVLTVVKSDAAAAAVTYGHDGKVVDKK